MVDVFSGKIGGLGSLARNRGAPTPDTRMMILTRNSTIQIIRLRMLNIVQVKKLLEYSFPCPDSARASARLLCIPKDRA